MSYAISFCKLRLQSYNFFLKKQRLDPKILKSCPIFSFAVAGCIEISRGKRMSKLLQDMSALTKLDEMDDRHSRENYHQVNVLQVIQNVLDDTALKLHDKGITPSLQVPRQMVNGQWSMVNVEVLGDASLIYSIFRNLIDNAISYATGASRLDIVCKETESEGRHFYEFLVSDNGPGVQPQHLDHLFERFYRIDKGRSRKLGGTGLGLSIVKNAVAVQEEQPLRNLRPAADSPSASPSRGFKLVRCATCLHSCCSDLFLPEPRSSRSRPDAHTRR